LNQQRWGESVNVALRSIVSIFISCISALYNSYRFDQLVLLPPVEVNIEKLELALHQPEAVKYFYNYLEQAETYSDSKINQFRLLALYMDIRCYDEDIRKFMRSSTMNN
jgi:hypothetical protein